MPDGLTPEEMTDKLSQPNYVMVDGSQVSQHPLPDVIEGDRYAKSLAAAETAVRPGVGKRYGMYWNSLKPGGCG